MALRRATRGVPKTLRLAALSSVRFYASSSYDSSSSYSSSPSSSKSQSSSDFSSSSNQNNSGESQAFFKARDDLTPLTIHIKGLPPTATKEKFTQALETSGVTGISRVAVPSNVWTQGSRGFAFVTFDSPESLAKAKTLPINYEGSQLTMSGARTKEESAKYKVYIGDLNYNTNDADLKTALEQFGPVEYAAVTSDGGASRGYAFATFKTIEGADAARAAAKFTLDDSVVRIEKVRINDDLRGGKFAAARGGDRYGSTSYGERKYGAERSYGDSDSFSSERGGRDRYSDRRGDRAGGSDRDRYGGERGGDRYGSGSGDRSSRGGDRGDRSDRSDRGSSRGGDRYGSGSGSGSSGSGSGSENLY